ncbi:hypothetical protein P153DRAFT_366571 [Dothidotthia symphoricarpi CBS 119687]|uniref:Uncharacterized protein n=1 Tax=Dothidotthia symphoricarpi CBS 119687 TaxID=1392245 RepID=A0A6A6AGC7_9PLEO|nr:uncharacterized protein P153DRAFT_366571 [Dothidotthia symphoricarpi CBS 119687]KAF2130098.1 hypothetical protein P153DRAFT_366571 [Dothidotthia symphoricarpi CBS 119687]
MASTSPPVTSLHRSADTKVKACSACIDTFSRYFERTYVRKLKSDLGSSAFHRPCLVLLRGLVDSTIMAVHGNGIQNINQSLSPPEQIEQCCLSKYYEWTHINPKQKITYDDWKKSEETKGLALYYAALNIWDEPDTDDEVENVAVVSRSRDVQVQSAREPKKTVTTNGHGRSHVAGSATPLTSANSEELSASGKRKPRKQRKKYLSEEIVASDGSDHGEMVTPIAGPAKSSRPAVTFSGGRKPSVRKAKKKRLSEQIISPEDEEDDSMALTEVWSPNIPVRSAPGVPAAAQHSDSPRRIVKLKVGFGKKAAKKLLSGESVLEKDRDNEGASAKIATSTIGTVVEDKAKTGSNANLYLSGTADVNGGSNSPAGSPGLQDDSSATTRRGLRMRRPAQRRPYYHDAQLFDESSAAEEEELEEGGEPVEQENDQPEQEQEEEQEEDIRPTSRGRSTRRVSYASIIGIDDELLSALDEQSKALLQEEDQDDDPNGRRPRHFKGKGRAWRKDESDEDLEFAPSKKKKLAKAKALTASGKKRGRPRKSALSEDIIHDDEDSDAATGAGDSMAGSPAPPTPVPTPASVTITKKRGRPRKSALSESVATYDSASENLNASAPPTPLLAPKKRGRPRKSDQSIMSREDNENGDENHDDDEEYSPKKSASKTKAKKPRVSGVSAPDAIPLPLDGSLDEDVRPDEVIAPSLSPSRKRKSVSDSEEEVVHDEASRDFAFDLLRGAGTLGGERKYHTKMQWN